MLQCRFGGFERGVAVDGQCPQLRRGLLIVALLFEREPELPVRVGFGRCVAFGGLREILREIAGCEIEILAAFDCSGASAE